VSALAFQLSLMLLLPKTVALAPVGDPKAKAVGMFMMDTSKTVMIKTAKSLDFLIN
jgi:hypothetical protein